jgi:hypothetical protein
MKDERMKDERMKDLERKEKERRSTSINRVKNFSALANSSLFEFVVMSLQSS